MVADAPRIYEEDEYSNYYGMVYYYDYADDGAFMCEFLGIGCTTSAPTPAGVDTYPPTSTPTPGPSYVPTSVPTPVPTAAPTVIENLARWDYCLQFDSDSNGDVTGLSNDGGFLSECSGADVANGNTVWKYPFTMWRAMLDVMQYYGVDHRGSTDVGMHSIPSMACPDCSVAKSNESYLSIKFALDLTTTLANVSEPATIDQTTTAGQAVTDAFPELPRARTRYVGRNALLFGPLLYQQRFTKLDSCDVNSDYLLKFFEDAGSQCGDWQNFWDDNGDVDLQSMDDYGVEASMNSDGTQFLDSVQSGVYRTSNAADSLPSGFSYDQGSGRPLNKVSFPYPILFDINFNQSKAYQVVNAISEGLYIDDYTASLNMLFCTYNPNAGLWAMTTLTWTPSIGGTWDFGSEGSIVSLNRYYTDSDHVRALPRLSRVLVCVVRSLLTRALRSRARRSATALRSLSSSCSRTSFASRFRRWSTRRERRRGAFSRTSPRPPTGSTCSSTRS